jgi:8-oxo-dGTP pyrophosphatase MutT (NUDIX family)
MLLTGLQFLLVRRRDSLSFIEFVRGKYSLADRDYIGSLLRGMSQGEQEKIRTQTFDELWRGVWGEAAGTHRMDYDASERKYRHLAPTREDLITLLAAHPSLWTEPEWGFPKGRRNPYESDLTGALREFMEETNLRRGEYKVIQNVEPLVETFIGSNNVQYCHKYYLAVCPENQEVALDRSNPHMAREIGDIGWFTIEEALTKIRPESVEKRELVLKVGRILRNFCPVEI